jgi:hypothetical protein
MGRGKDMREAPGSDGAQRGRQIDEWLLLPGLYRRFEFERLVEVEREFYIEPAGHDDRGMALHRIYYRGRRPGADASDSRSQNAFLARSGA